MTGKPPIKAQERRTLSKVSDLGEFSTFFDHRGRGDLNAVADRFAIGVSPAMADLIDRNDPADPIARQFLPDARELISTPEELADPIADKLYTRVKGIVHRYPDRALLKLTHLCPVYCRFCFRREMVGPGNADAMNDVEIATAIDYIRYTPAIWEVIVTGGDPLVLSARRIREVSAALGRIPHVRVIRWHTRVPVVRPEWVTPDLVDALVAAGKTVYIGIHANHPRELTTAARAGIGRLADAGLALVSQTVLLKGVNDDPEVMAQLMRAFVECRVRPYYLHQGDLARGTSHFRTSIQQGQALMRALRGHLSGLAQPTYVMDIPGGHGKVPIGPGYLDTSAPGDMMIEDYEGRRHALSQGQPGEGGKRDAT